MAAALRLALVVVASCLCAVLTVWPFDARAASGSVGPPTIVPLFARGPWGPGPAGVVCSQIAASRNPPNTAKVDTPTINDASVICYEYGADGSFQGTDSLFQVGRDTTCAPNSTLNSADGMCYCNPGYYANGPVCVQSAPTPVPHPCPGVGTQSPDDGNQYTVGQGPGGSFCHDGCSYWPMAYTVPADGSPGMSYGPSISTGQTCGANAGASGNPKGAQQGDEAPADNPLHCQDPTACPGTVNGTPVCVACGGAGGTTVSQGTSTAPDGSTAPGDTVVKQTTNNPDGTTTTTTTTYHPDGSVGTTVVVGKTGSSGGASGGGGSSAGTGNCIGNDCGNGTDSFGGSCGGTFTCDGDAIQCAIAKEQHIRACQAFEPSTAGGDWADGADKLSKAKADGDVPSWSPSHPGNAVETNFDWASTIDHSSSFASACPSDVPVGSTGLVLQLSSLCPYFGVLGTFIEAMTAIACAFILFKGTR